MKLATISQRQQKLQPSSGGDKKAAGTVSKVAIINHQHSKKQQ